MRNEPSEQRGPLTQRFRQWSKYMSNTEQNLKFSNSNVSYTSEVRFISMYQTAKFWISLGFSVIPIRRLSNTPATPHGLLDATNQEAFIEKYFSRSTIRGIPDVNIATVPLVGSKLFTIDVDLHGDTNGVKSWRSLTENKCVPRTNIELTQRKGLHLDFIAPFVVRSMTGILPGIDILGQAHYCIRTPSVREYGQYRLFQAPIADAPEWLVELLDKGRNNGPAEPVLFDYQPTGEVDTDTIIATLLPYWSKAPVGHSYRYRMAAALSGYLLRKNAPVKDVKRIIFELGRLSGHKDHSKVVDYTVGHLEHGYAVGGQTLLVIMEELDGS